MIDTLTTATQSNWDAGEPLGYAALMVTLFASLVYQFWFGGAE